MINNRRIVDMSVEGIFRKNGNIKRLREVTEAIDQESLSVDLSQDNPVQLAALLKKFLRDLPDPLMTYKLHRLLIASQGMLLIFSMLEVSNGMPQRCHKQLTVCGTCT
jgi:hypothetical protein